MNYRDGQEAKMRDFVRGRPINTTHEVCGEVLALDEGASTVRIAWVEITEASPVDRVMRERAFLEHARVWVFARSDFGPSLAFDLLYRPGGPTP